MHRLARDRVRELTAVLSAVSVAVVFAAAGGVIPGRLLPRVPPLVATIPHVNAAISLLAIATIAFGVRNIRRGNVGRHRAGMLATTGLFVTFLVLYLYRIVLEGPTEFTGPDVVYQFVYLPILAVHVLLAVAAIPPVYYVLLLALTHDTSELGATPHPTAGKVAASLWVVSFGLGIVVYLLLYAAF
jgi:putative membrane protein